MSYQSRQRIADQSVMFVTPAIVTAVAASPPGHDVQALARSRIAARRNLAAMDARSLRDAGISPAAAAYESGKSFWQAFGPLR